MDAFSKTVHLGRGETSGAKTFCRIEYDGKRLSITGVEGPMRNGDCRGSCGQIVMSLRERPGMREYAPGWDAALVDRFLATWDRWHLNDMRAGCEHQRALGWQSACNASLYGGACVCEEPRGIDPGPLMDARANRASYLHSSCKGDTLMVACPSCGYKYGSAWLFEPVPDDVLSFLHGLPESELVPAWV